MSFFLPSGFFLASYLGRTADPPPVALFSIAGINSFTDPFYSSSVLVTPEPTPYSAVAPALDADSPLVVGRSIPKGHENASIFRPEALLQDGRRDPDFQLPVAEEEDTRTEAEKRLWEARALLYRYFIHQNRWPALTAALDGGREWRGWERERKEKWPRTVVVHGSGDAAVPLRVSEELREVMGGQRVEVVVAEGQDHLFERAMFLEEQRPGMDAVREASAKLVEVVNNA